MTTSTRPDTILVQLSRQLEGLFSHRRRCHSYLRRSDSRHGFWPAQRPLYATYFYHFIMVAVPGSCTDMPMQCKLPKAMLFRFIRDSTTSVENLKCCLGSICL